MASSAHDLTPVQLTALLTAHGRALDSQAHRPILRDILCEEIAQKVDGVTRTKVLTATRLQIAVRAKGLDRSMRRCLTDQSDALALDLGPGLDTRVFRI